MIARTEAQRHASLRFAGPAKLTASVGTMQVDIWQSQCR